MDVPGFAGATGIMARQIIVFRADASLEMGIGHIMRCLTLANALKASGYECHFICRTHTGHLNDYLLQQGHKVHALRHVPGAETDKSPAHASWLGATQAEDAAQCAIILAPLQPQWLIVDHYALDACWEQRLKSFCKRLLVIDDLADRPHQCDVLLDQTLGRDPDDYRAWIPAASTVLCGSQYALLRPEFAALRPYSIQRREVAPLRHILISMGGVDKDNVTGQILASLATMALPRECRITVIVGATSPWLQAIERQAASLRLPIVIRSGVSDMAQLMADSDLAIGAAGATSWERCCLGLPTIMVVQAANQQNVAKGLKAICAVELIETLQDIPQVLPKLMGVLLHKGKRLQQMSKAAADVTDGTGTFRVMGYLE